LIFLKILSLPSIKKIIKIINKEVKENKKEIDLKEEIGEKKEKEEIKDKEDHIVVEKVMREVKEVTVVNEVIKTNEDRKRNMLINKQVNNVRIRSSTNKKNFNNQIVMNINIFIGQYTKKQSQEIGELIGNFRNKPL
jgi:hypothetical protein